MRKPKSVQENEPHNIIPAGRSEPVLSFDPLNNKEEEDVPVCRIA